VRECVPDWWCGVVSARSPVVGEEVSAPAVKRRRSPRGSSSEPQPPPPLFSLKIESERPVAVHRTDSTRATASHVTKHLLVPPANTFVPISVAEQFSHSDDELAATFYEHQRTVQLLQVRSA